MPIDWSIRCTFGGAQNIIEELFCSCDAFIALLSNDDTFKMHGQSLIVFKYLTINIIKMHYIKFACKQWTHSCNKICDSFVCNNVVVWNKNRCLMSLNSEFIIQTSHWRTTNLSIFLVYFVQFKEVSIRFFSSHFCVSNYFSMNVFLNSFHFDQFASHKNAWNQLQMVKFVPFIWHEWIERVREIKNLAWKRSIEKYWHQVIWKKSEMNWNVLKKWMRRTNDFKLMTLKES